MLPETPATPPLRNPLCLSLPWPLTERLVWDTALAPEAHGLGSNLPTDYQLCDELQALPVPQLPVDNKDSGPISSKIFNVSETGTPPTIYDMSKFN